MRSLLRLVVACVLVGAGVAMTAVALIPQASALLTASSSSASDLDLAPLSQRSVVYDRDGEVLAVLVGPDSNRLPVALSEVPQHVVEAFLAVEDADFYVHNGVNLRATIRALFANVAAGGVEQGGSTITQQVVKNALLTPEQDAGRKIKEAVLALRLEQQMTKDEILERYLNSIYLGNGAYGVKAAAEVYWGYDSLDDLTIQDAALLAGMARSPAGYDPIANPDLTRARRQEALNRMADAGYLSQDEANLLSLAEMPTELVGKPPPVEEYFVAEVRRQLLADERLGETYEDRFNLVFNGGLHIHTTFDRRMQAAALAARDEHVPDTGGRFTAALVALEPGTGAVRAMVGGEGFGSDQYNIAVNRPGRQPGSSFKPFVLAAALEQGAQATDTIDGSSPCTFEMPAGQEDYVVRSPGGSGTLVNVTARSINCAYVRMGLMVGMDKVVEMAARLGIDAEIDPFPAASLGTEEVAPIDMAQAYAVFANGGVRHEPYYIDRVETDGGEILIQHEAAGEQVIDPELAAEVTQVLRAAVESGTGTRARIPGRQVAGKTGTTDKKADAWFVGYTPELATAVWMGNPREAEPMSNVGGIDVFGGTYPARIWQSFSAAALEGTEPTPFPAPPRPVRGGARLDWEGEARCRVPVGGDGPAWPGVNSEGGIWLPCDALQREAAARGLTGRVQNLAPATRATTAPRATAPPATQAPPATAAPPPSTAAGPLSPVPAPTSAAAPPP